MAVLSVVETKKRLGLNFHILLFRRSADGADLDEKFQLFLYIYIKNSIFTILQNSCPIIQCFLALEPFMQNAKIFIFYVFFFKKPSSCSLQKKFLDKTFFQIY